MPSGFNRVSLKSRLKTSIILYRYHGTHHLYAMRQADQLAYAHGYLVRRGCAMHTPQAVRRGPLSDSELLQVTYGCPWAKCLFCNLYEHEEFGVVPMAHICLPQPRKKFLPQSQS